MQIILCSYMCVEAGVQAYRNGYNVVCNPFSYTNPSMANLLWLFYVSKVFDFLDTVFIILGKKWKQLSVLHVYHHTTIFLIYWLNLRVGFDGDIYLTIILNGYIHTIMYTYYFICQHTKVRFSMRAIILPNALISWLSNRFLKRCKKPSRFQTTKSIFPFGGRNTSQGHSW